MPALVSGHPDFAIATRAPWFPCFHPSFHSWMLQSPKPLQFLPKYHPDSSRGSFPRGPVPRGREGGDFGVTRRHLCSGCCHLVGTAAAPDSCPKQPDQGGENGVKNPKFGQNQNSPDGLASKRRRQVTQRRPKKGKLEETLFLFCGTTGYPKTPREPPSFVSVKPPAADTP